MQTRRDVRLVLGLILATVIAICSPKCLAQSTNAPARLTYDSFRMVSDRNIFNPNRYARSTGRPATTRSTRPAQRVESFSLVGIMAYEKGTFAFFDGSKSDYKAALQAGATIGDYTVAQVNPETVQLALGTNTFDLKVGMQMRREDEGDWFLSAGDDAPRRRVASARPRTRTSPSADGASGSDEMLPESGEPEVIVIDGGNLTEPNGGENQNGGENGTANGTANGTPARTEEAADASGITDPVLLRLMQRRQQMNQ